MRADRMKFILGGTLIVAAMGVLMAVSFQGNMAYYLEVSEFLQKDNPAMRGNYRVRGNVVPGTIVKRAGELGAEFEMTDGTHAIRVRYLREVPDTFVDRAEVVVEGEMGPDQVFLAHTLLAKCPSKYEVGSEATDPA